MSFSLSDFLKKIDDRDPDLRHMALYDLHNELEKDSFSITDDGSQRQFSDKVIERLNDTSSDVQGMAVKCLAPLVKKMSLTQIQTTVEKVTSLVFGKEEKKDIATIAMKNVITELPAEFAADCIPKATGSIVAGLKTAETNVKLEAIDILTKILERFGTVVQKEHGNIQKSLTAELAAGSSSIRKRATTAIAALSVHSGDNLFSSLVESLLQNIKGSTGDDLRTNIQAVSAISRTAGGRLAKYLDNIVPMLLDSAVELGGEEEEEEAEADEVRENIIQAYESLILRCPQEIAGYLDVIVDQCKQFLEYDPNYEEEEDEEEEEEEADEDEDEDMADDEEDDEDVSWKVRKAATKCLAAVAKTRPDSLELLYTELLSPEDPILIKRFKEREHRVKVDNFNTFNDIANGSIIVSGSAATSGSGLPVVRQRGEISHLREIKDVAVKSLKKQLKFKNDKVRIGIFSVLKTLAIALQGELGNNVSTFVSMLQASLGQKKAQSNSTLKIEALSFLRMLLASHGAETFKAHAKALSGIIFSAVQDKYFKITAESLRVCGELVKVNAALKGSAEHESSVKELYKAIMGRLEVPDIDQDVKESAITAMGILIAQLGDVIQKELPATFAVLLERLKNEITRTSVTKAFGMIADSPLHVDLSKIMPELLSTLSDFLRKNDRALKQATLVTLGSLVQNYSAKIDSKQYKTIIDEAAALVSDADLQIAHLALDLTSSILNANPKNSDVVEKVIFPKILELLKSSTLQGQALESTNVLLGKLTQSIKFETILSAVLNVVDKDSTKQVFSNVAKSVAVICANAKESQRDGQVETFVKDLKSTKDDNSKILALFCLGEIGLTANLSKHAALQGSIEACFESGSEELKNAASFALGNVAVGALDTYLPSILSEIKQQNSRRKYLLLHSLKEIITRASVEKLHPFNGEILPLLFEFTEVEEDGVRNIVAECLGKIALTDPATVFPQLKDALSGSEFKRSTVVSAMKYTVTEQPQKIDELLKTDLSTFINLLDKAQPVSVRRAVVLLINATAHNKPALLSKVIGSTLPKLYAETPVDQSLIREIKLGPFTHKVDDGLELRKATFECLDSLHDSCLEYIDPLSFIEAVSNGLTDMNQDIRMLTYIILSKLSESSTGNLISSLENMFEPLSATLKKKLKDNVVQQEKDRHEEELKAALRMVHSLAIAMKVNNAENNAKFEAIMKIVSGDAALKDMYRAIAGDDQVVPMEM